MFPTPNEFEEPAALPAVLRDFGPRTGLVLGSGLGPFVEAVEVEASVAYSEIDGLPASAVPGHEGRFLCAKLGEARLLIAQGRVHRYEGHEAAEVTAGIRAMIAAGCTRIILTNAAGSVNPDFPVGDWMMLSDHLNLTGTTPLLGGPHFVDMTEVYSQELRSRFRSAAVEQGLSLREGVYAGLLGPQYETPAEVKMVRTMGGDAVGMSTVLEAIQARALGCEVAGFSCLTNMGAGIGGTELDHEEVLEVGQSAAAKLVALLRVSLAE